MKDEGILLIINDTPGFFKYQQLAGHPKGLVSSVYSFISLIFVIYFNKKKFGILNNCSENS